MKTHKLGNSDLKVPVVCMGTMTFGSQNSEEEAFEMLDYCLDKGVNFVDTAELYPVPPCKETINRTEIIIGKWLTARGCRDKVILATKVAAPFPGLDRSFITANRHEPPLAPEAAGQPNLDEANIRAALAASLRRLNTDYVDLYQIHWPARYAPVFGARQYIPSKEVDAVSFDEQVSTIGRLIKEGKIKYWGLSNETTFGVVHFCEACKRLGVPLPVSIQNDYSLVVRPFDGDLAEACSPRNYNIGLLAYGSLAGGTLSGKYLGDTPPPPGSRHVLFPGFQPRYHAPRTMAAAADYAALAARKGLSPTQLAYAWAASRWFIGGMGSVIIGATTMAQLRESIDACLVQLDADTLAEVDELFKKHGNTNLTD